MSELKLTATHLREGVWEGVLTAPQTDGDSRPEIKVTHLAQSLEEVTVTEDKALGHWMVRVPIPVTALSDGMQTFLVSDARNGDKLTSFAILAGETLDDDFRVELDLLRAELDMLKKAFRRHCVETMG